MATKKVAKKAEENEIKSLGEALEELKKLVAPKELKRVKANKSALELYKKYTAEIKRLQNEAVKLEKAYEVNRKKFWEALRKNIGVAKDTSLQWDPKTKEVIVLE